MARSRKWRHGRCSVHAQVQQLLASPALANATGYLEGMVAGGREGLAELVQDTYLADIGLPQYVELMRGQEVTPLVLAGMKDRDLEKLGVETVGARRRISEAARQYGAKVKSTAKMMAVYRDGQSLAASSPAASHASHASHAHVAHAMAAAQHMQHQRQQAAASAASVSNAAVLGLGHGGPGGLGPVGLEALGLGHGLGHGLGLGLGLGLEHAPHVPHSEVASVAGDGHVATVGAVGTGGAVAAVGGGPGVPPAATAAAAAPGMLDA
ncbi:hypothetical protein CHLRE_02g141746v5 [Chlamydomonas reinhardtii]|uniref:SAM domain-containing protein n=1 Tax=Chlamydomonas reinhardtii TaxID=3055 RepID=A0A2K3E4A5_CHLRE|nr:uncharacterized protein CHLRE_02g141746v5 [Chlamydomonas reinhardtii]PNW87619.1 hypothetical protein CHLRE_02g141746v5 [Chlamydomonas reinhardtii]